ncbi:MAG: hypothetical protein ACTS78_03135 [Arsenophonus sp. NC-WZS1-MAG3]
MIQQFVAALSEVCKSGEELLLWLVKGILYHNFKASEEGDFR